MEAGCEEGRENQKTALQPEALERTDAVIGDSLRLVLEKRNKMLSDLSKATLAKMKIVGPDEKWNAETKTPTHALKIFTPLQDAEHSVNISQKEKAEQMRRRAGQFMADAMVIAAEYETIADAEELKGLRSEVESLNKKNKDLGDHLTESSSKIKDLVAQKTNMEKERTNLAGELVTWKERAEKAERLNISFSSQVKELKKKLENNASDHQSELESLRSAHQSEIKKLSAELKSARKKLERTEEETRQSKEQAMKFRSLYHSQVKELKKLKNNASDHQSELESEIKKLSVELESTRDKLERTKEEAARTFLVGAGADLSGKQFEDYQAELNEELCLLEEQKARNG